MKKILIAVLVLLLTVSVSACTKEDVDDGKNNIQSVDISVADIFTLSQNEENTKKVDFIATLQNVEGVIFWYVNNVLRESSGTTFSFTPNLAGTYRVYFKVEITDGTELRSKTIEIGVTTATSAQINVSVENPILLEQYENDYKAVEFSAKIEGNYENAENKIVWFVNDEIQYGSLGNNKFSFTPTKKGDYIVRAEVDGKFKSNFYKINVTTGKIVLKSPSALEQADGETSEVVMTAETAGSAVDGEIKWYINGAQISTSENVLRFTPDTVGAYEVIAKYDDVASEAKYVIVGTKVSSETELINALETEDAILLTKDIIVDVARINVNRKVAVAGGGHTITSGVGTNILMNVSADNVVIYNLKLSDAAKYPLQFYKAKNCYIEKVSLDNAGYSGLHLNRAQVTVKDILVTNSNFAGAEISHDDYNIETLSNGTKNDWYHLPSIMTVLGDFVYLNGELPAPIYSLYNSDACRLVSESFNEFAISAMVSGNEKIIRRWCNDGCNIGWTIKAPSKTEYLVGEALFLDDIGLRVSYCNQSMVFDMNYIYMALDYNFTARIDFLADDGQVYKSFYIDSYDKGTHKLLFKDKDGNPIDCVLDSATIVQIKIYVAELYVGNYSVAVV